MLGASSGLDKASKKKRREERERERIEREKERGRGEREMERMEAPSYRLQYTHTYVRAIARGTRPERCFPSGNKLSIYFFTCLEILKWTSY